MESNKQTDTLAYNHNTKQESKESTVTQNKQANTEAIKQTDRIISMQTIYQTCKQASKQNHKLNK